MLHNPFFIEVSLPAGSYRTLELIPVYRQQADRYVATRNYQIYISNNTDEQPCLENFDLTGVANPGFLGELQFTGLAYFEWRYIGPQLNFSEVWQIVDLLQNCVRTYI